MATEKSVMTVIRASRPSFRNNHDKVAFAVHASFIASGFVLVATGSRAFTEAALSSSSTEEVGIEHWKEFDDEYAFVYVNPEKGNKNVLVKCLVMSDKLLVDALSEGAPEPVHLEIDVDEYVGENGVNNYNTQYKNLGKLVSSLNSNVLSRLYGSSTSSSAVGPSSSKTMEGHSTSFDVNEPQDSRDFYPVSKTMEGHSTSFDVNEPQDSRDFYPVIAFPPVHPAGNDDLFPGPGAGIYPTRPNFAGDGSLLIGPNDPRWFGDRGGLPGFPGGIVPPGSRFDPYGPPGNPGFEPSPYGPFGVRSRFPRRPGDAHPDIEQPGARNGSDFI